MCECWKNPKKITYYVAITNLFLGGGLLIGGIITAVQHGLLTYPIVFIIISVLFTPSAFIPCLEKEKSYILFFCMSSLSGWIATMAGVIMTHFQHIYAKVIIIVYLVHMIINHIRVYEYYKQIAEENLPVATESENYNENHII